jgi:signal transduction histidine kinase
VNIKTNDIGNTELSFFGKMVASISHEIKNSLAIIDGNAGLIEDYMELLENGRSIEPPRLRSLAEKINDQIHQADALVRKLNRFAHIVDEPLKSVDLNEILELMVALSVRMAAAKHVTLSTPPADGPVVVTASPFLLLNVLIHCLEQALQVGSGDRSIQVSAVATESGARIDFAPLPELTEIQAAAFLSDRDSALLQALDADLQVDPQPGKISIRLVKR